MAICIGPIRISSKAYSSCRTLIIGGLYSVKSVIILTSFWQSGMLEVFIAGIPVVLASDHKWRGRTFLPLNYCNQLSLPRKISSFLWIFTLAPLSMKLHYTLFGSPRKADNSTQSASAPFSDQWGARFPDPHVSSLLTCHYDRHLSNDRHLLSNISFHVKGLQTFINNLFSEVRHQAYFSVSQVSFQTE